MHAPDPDPRPPPDPRPLLPREGSKKFRPNYEAINTLKKAAVQEADRKRRKPKPSAPRKREGWVVEAASGANSVAVAPRPPPRTPEQERAATYAAPTLKRKREEEPAAAAKAGKKAATARPPQAARPSPPGQPVPDGLTKAQRKNFKRSLRRAKKTEQVQA